MARVLPATSGERARTPASSQASGSTTLDPRRLGSRPPPRPDEEEEESEGESGSGGGQATERDSVVSMDIDPFLPMPTPSLLPISNPPPTRQQSAIPHLSIDDPIGDALDIVMQAAAEPSQDSSSLPERHDQSPGEGWYEHIQESAHVWLDIPPLQTVNHGSSDLIPAKYLKAALVAGVPMLLGCQGRQEQVYSEQLTARPFHAPASRYHNPSPIEILENPFDPRVERALLFLGDLGVMGDIYSLRSIPLRREGLYRRKDDVIRDLDILGARPQAPPFTETANDFERLRIRLESIQAIESHLNTLEKEVKDRLKAAQVLLRITPLLKVDKEPGEVPSTRLFPRLTGNKAKVDTWLRTTRGGIRRAPGEPANPGARLRTRRQRTRCAFCQMMGHFNKDCRSPHAKCSEHRCEVPQRHSSYEPRITCPYWFRLAAARPMSTVEQDTANQDYYEDGYIDFGSD